MNAADIIEANLERGELLIAMNEDALAEVSAHPRRIRRNRKLLRETRARIQEVDYILRRNNFLMPYV